MKKKKRIWLKITVFLIIFIMMFSVLGVVIMYLKGIDAKEAARQQALQQQEQQEETDTAVINVPQIKVIEDGETENEIAIAPTEENNQEGDTREE